MPVHTRLCDLLGISHPILLAGMGGGGTPGVAAAGSKSRGLGVVGAAGGGAGAVWSAGGLGVLGAAGCGPNKLRSWIQRTRALTDKPFGVDTLLPASVRRGGGKENTGGPSAAEMVPQHKRFAEWFLAEQ